MRHSINKRIGLLFTALTVALCAMADAELRNLSIDVLLLDNGDARITELRQMSIDSEGTECYIVIGNLNGSDIENFTVSDETGQTYRNIGKWNVKASRQEKANKCGIVTTDDGYELCWGLGLPGERAYVVSYTVKNLVRSYRESDGFNWMFVTYDMKPSPQKAKVVITSDRDGGLPEDSVKAWSFGFVGQVSLDVDNVTVYTTEPMDPSNAMIVMVELPKGMLHPTLQKNKKFQEVIDEAFEGSNYVVEKKPWYKEAWDAIVNNFQAVVGLLFVGFMLFLVMWSTYVKRRERKKLLATVDWYREIPANGNLLQARKLYDAFYASGGISTEDMLGAMILRFVRTGTLRIEPRYVEPTGLKKIMGGEGKVQDCIIVADFNEHNRLINSPFMRTLYDMLRAASGDDLVLQPNELKKWMKNNKKEVVSFVNTLTGSMSLKEAKKQIDDVRKVFGLKKFLSDFTLANERHLTEVALWNDYLVYATLFGIADQVKADMAKVNPEYLKMNEIAKNMTNQTVLPVLMHTTYHTAYDVHHAATRSSGGGGSSSLGGGGGFSGGGHGGGVR